MNSSFSFAQRSQGDAGMGGIGGKGGNGYDLEIFHTITSIYYFYDQHDCADVVATNKQILPLICKELEFKAARKDLTPDQNLFHFDCCRIPRE